MADEVQTLHDFISHIKFNGVASPQQFECEIILPLAIQFAFPDGNRNLRLMCSVSQLPSVAVFTNDINTFGPTTPTPYSTFYDRLYIEFYLEESMATKEVFDAWIYSIVNPKTFKFNFKSEYETTVFIKQLDDANNVRYTVRLNSAYPTELYAMQLRGDSKSDAHRLTVQFVYRSWDSFTS